MLFNPQNKYHHSEHINCLYSELCVTLIHGQENYNENNHCQNTNVM